MEERTAEDDVVVDTEGERAPAADMHISSAG